MSFEILTAKINGNNVIEEISQSYCDFLGYKKEEMIGEKIGRFRSHNFSEKTEEDLISVLTSGNSYHGFTLELTKSREEKSFEMTLIPVGGKGDYQGYRLIKKPVGADKISEIKEKNHKLSTNKYLISNGLIKNSFLSKTFGRAFDFKLLTMLGISISIIISFLVLLAFAFDQYKINEIENKSIYKYSSVIEAELDATLLKKTGLGEISLVGLFKGAYIKSMIAEKDLEALYDEYHDIKEHFRKNSKLKNLEVAIYDRDGYKFFKSGVALELQQEASSPSPHILDQISNPRPYSYYVVDSTGISLRSVMPIYVEDEEKPVGYAEIKQRFNSVKKYLERENGHFFLFALNNEHINQLDYESKKNNLQNPFIGTDKQYRLCSKNKTKTCKVTEEHYDFLNKINIGELSKKGALISGGYFIYAKPVYNFENKEIGLAIVSMEASHYLDFLDKETSVVHFAFYGVVGTSIVLFIVFLVLSWFQIISPLNRISTQIKNANKTSDLNLRLDVIGKNEIAEVAQAYNNQISEFQSVSADISLTLNEIVSGNLDSKIDSNYKGDFQLLKEQVNSAGLELKITFEKIDQVLVDLREGNFKEVHSNNLKGTYHSILSSAIQSMSDLSYVISEIDNVLNQAAKGDFENRVALETKGEVLKLANIVNQSMSNLNNGFEDIVIAAQRLSNGDFTQEITGNYEYKMLEAKEAINLSVVSLREIVGTVKEVSSEVSIISSTVHSGTDSLNSRTQEQAALLEETSSAMEETSAQVSSNLESTTSVLGLTTEMEGTLGGANKKMGETQNSMKKILDTSVSIKEIISMIDSIAFQTNLLALNAAVEAARAGDNGRGFAVVAGEVRNLAQKSANAASEISQLIEESGQAVEGGVKEVDSVSEYLRKITSQTSEISQVMSEIQVASKEQAAGISDINKSIINMDSVTQQNAALVEETFASVDELTQSSNSLNNSVKELKI